MFQKLVKIEDELIGNEYCAYDASYLISFDILDSNLPLEKAIKNSLVEYEVITTDSDEITLELVPNYTEDIRSLFDKWHLSMITNNVLEILGNNSKVYKILDDNKIYISDRSLCSAFRVFENSNERILVELYITD